MLTGIFFFQITAVRKGVYAYSMDAMLLATRACML